MSKMTAKEGRFVTLYIEEGLKDPLKAALDAGYTEKTAGPGACKLLKRRVVQRGIEEALSSHLARLMNQYRLLALERIKRIAMGQETENSKGEEVPPSLQTQLKGLELLSKVVDLAGAKGKGQGNTESSELPKEALKALSDIKKSIKAE